MTANRNVIDADIPNLKEMGEMAAYLHLLPISTSYSTMGNKPQVITAYPNAEPKSQEQNLPGTEQDMEPLAGTVIDICSKEPSTERLYLIYDILTEHTKIERWDENGNPFLAEYVGVGKLKGKSVLVTGGDSGIGKSVASQYQSIITLLNYT